MDIGISFEQGRDKMWFFLLYIVSVDRSPSYYKTLGKEVKFSNKMMKIQWENRKKKIFGNDRVKTKGKEEKKKAI